MVFAGHWQLPPTQLRPPVQVTPHAPQLRLSPPRSTQDRPHTVWPAPQPPEQTPFEQTWVGAQTIPQPPQWRGSLAISTHIVPQRTPLRQPHTPPVQVMPPLHVTPHAPQLSALTLRSTQAPPQGTAPAPQIDVQLP